MNNLGDRMNKEFHVQSVKIHVIQNESKFEMKNVKISTFFSVLRLCMNVCNAADLWANCLELYRTWPGWLCRSNTTEGLTRQKSCLATCNCQEKIHD